VTTYRDTEWWQRLERLAAVGPAPGEEAEAEEFIAAAEKMMNAAKALIQLLTRAVARTRSVAVPSVWV
jgi:ABC-type Fe2+-enterobactin transport system substrate-binding protein